MTDCRVFSRIQIETYFAGGFDDSTRAEIADHVGNCASCGDYLRKLREHKRAFLEEYPHGSIQSVEPRLRGRGFRPIYALAASLLIMVGGVGVSLMQMRRETVAVGTKGDVAIDVLVMSRDGRLQARPDHVYHPGERIQLTYSCGSDNKLILLSIDQTGAITAYYPRQGDSSITVEPGRDIPLPNSIELDEFIGKEMLIAVFSKEPLSLERVIGGVRRSFDAAKKLNGLALRIEGEAIVRKVLYTKTGEQM